MSPFIVDPASLPSLTGMTLLAMRTELYARGFDYLSITRANYFINNAYTDLCEDDVKYGGTWPFLERTATGAAPNTFSDLRQILSVTDSVTKIPLEPMDRRTLLEMYSGDLTLTGTPTYFYLEGETLNVFPVNTDSLSIRYAITVPDLVNDADTALVPSRYCNLIVDGAVLQAYEDSDNLMSAYALRNSLDEKESDMADTLLFRTGRAPDMVASTSYHGDW